MQTQTMFANVGTMSKPASRAKVIKALQKLLGAKWFLRTTEEFYGKSSSGMQGIWTTNEHQSDALDGETIYGSYTTYQTHPKVEALLSELGWFCEPHDAGTLMLWPM